MQATALKRSKKWVESMGIGLFISGLVYICFFAAVKAFTNPQCEEWLNSVIQLIAFLFAILIFNKDEVRRHTWKFLISLLIGFVAGKFVPALFELNKTYEKEKIKAKCEDQGNKIVIDMSALPESVRNSFDQISIVVENDQTHTITIFRPLLLQGLPLITHQFSAEEKELVSKSEFLQLRFSNRFLSETALVFQVKCPSKVP